MAARRAVEQELTREMILNAARELFVEKGYQHASMRQLAQVLGYSHGAIYYHFKNKAELYYALVKIDFSLLDHKLEEVLNEETDRRTKLENVLMGFIQFGLENQSHYEIMFMVKDKEVQAFLEQEPNQSYEKFANALYELTDKKITLPLIWSAFLSLHGFVSKYCSVGASFQEVKPIAKAHVQFILNGLK